MPDLNGTSHVYARFSLHIFYAKTIGEKTKKTTTSVVDVKTLHDFEKQTFTDVFIYDGFHVGFHKFS